MEERLIEKLKSGDSGFICKRIVRTKKGKPIFPKQIGYTEELPARTTEELILQIEKLASKYLELLKEW